MPLGKMVLASAATPYYFKPATINGDFYISGDNVALSPAMFSFFHANEYLGVDTSKIRVLSVGATNELAEKIDKKASVLEWTTRLTSLVGPVKKHT
jgi:predicted acylesterase/phospholipase RssA